MKTLLLTGATGFLGGAVLERLLKDNQGVNYLILVRAENVQQGLNRIRANMEKFNIDKTTLDKLTPENILLGDLSEPTHFLSDTRINTVTHVVNCAAVASFGNNPLIWKVDLTRQ
nr:SDR family oxidoreductase [Serratia oryzae]